MANYKWEPGHINVPLPENAVVGGRESDGSVVYVARSMYFGIKLPAKAIPNKRACYTSFNGLEISIERFEVLTGDSSNFSWEPSTDGKAVAYALSTDKIGNEEIFIGRPPFSNNSTTIGRILSSHRCLYIPFKGKEHRIEHYEILVYRKNPIIRNSIGFIQPLYPTRLFDGEIIRGSSAQTLLSYASSSLLQTASNLKWTHTTSRSSIPPTAIFGGRDSNFSIQHIGRCMHEGNLLPCRVVPSKLVALVTSNGIEIEKQTFQILIGSHSKWISSSGGNVPANAFPGGCTKEEEVLYIGRTYYKGGLIVGKVHKSHRCIYVGYNGRELSFPDYEVLIED